MWVRVGDWELNSNWEWEWDMDWNWTKIGIENGSGFKQGRELYTQNTKSSVGTRSDLILVPQPSLRKERSPRSPISQRSGKGRRSPTDVRNQTPGTEVKVSVVIVQFRSEI